MYKIDTRRGFSRRVPRRNVLDAMATTQFGETKAVAYTTVGLTGVRLSISKESKPNSIEKVDQHNVCLHATFS